MWGESEDAQEQFWHQIENYLHHGQRQEIVNVDVPSVRPHTQGLKSMTELGLDD
jgi:hypothetical protein